MTKSAKHQEPDDALEGELVDESADASTALAIDSITRVAIDSITRAEIDIQVATAKRYPRSIARVKAEIVAMATLDEETAESCFYSLKRKDASGEQKVIQGPSIRLAEIALSCFGNIRAGTRSLGETEDGRFVRELGVCHDVEKNVMVAREVKRRITTREGRRYGDDMVGTTMAAAGSIALRNAVLTVVPRALVKPAYLKAKEVALGKTKSLTVRRGEILDRLKKRSPIITNEKILAAVGKGTVDEIGWDEIDFLIGLGTAIRDGMQTVEEAFPEPAAGSTSVSEILPGMGDAAEPPLALTLEVVSRMKALATSVGASWQAVEEAFGGPLVGMAVREVDVEASIRELAGRG